jgi:pilus assembly protein CpaF
VRASLQDVRAQLDPILPLFDDPTCSEIMINGDGRVFAQRRGKIEHFPDIAFGDGVIAAVIAGIASDNQQVVDVDHPLLTAKLYDGNRIVARVAAVLEPCSVTGAALDIRLFPPLRRMSELIARGMITMDQSVRILGLLHRNANFLIAGATGAGKSTVSASLIAEFPAADRIVIIEDTAEIQANNLNLVRLETVAAVHGDNVYEFGTAAVPIRALLRQALRMCPTKIIIGEIRGPEAYDVIQALNSGHRGSVCTIHANSAADAIDRMTDCALEANIGWSEAMARKRVVKAIDVVLFVELLEDGTRRVTDIYEPEKGQTDAYSNPLESLACTDRNCDRPDHRVRRLPDGTIAGLEHPSAREMVGPPYS